MRLPIRVESRGRAYSGLRVHGGRGGDGAVMVWGWGGVAVGHGGSRLATLVVDVRLSVCLFPLTQTVPPPLPSPSHRRPSLFPLPTWIPFDRSDAVYALEH